MAEPLRHRQTKEAATDMFSLKPPRHISTLPIASWPALAGRRNAPKADVSQSIGICREGPTADIERIIRPLPWSRRLSLLASFLLVRAKPPSSECRVKVPCRSEWVSRLPPRSHRFHERQSPVILPGRGQNRTATATRSATATAAMVNSVIAFIVSSCSSTGKAQLVRWSHYAAGQAVSPWEAPELF
jgi:hypothetical protein